MPWIIGAVVVSIAVYLLLTWRPSGPKYELKCEIAELRKRYMLYGMMLRDVIAYGHKEMVDGIVKDMEETKKQLRSKEQELEDFKNKA